MESNDYIIPGFDDEWDKSLKIELSSVDSISKGILVYLKGSIDSYNSVFFENKLKKILASGYVNVIFNCGGLTYISSMGIGLFASYFSRFKEQFGGIVFLDLQPKVLEVFQLLGFSNFFCCCKNLTEAVAYFHDGMAVKLNTFPKLFECPLCNVHLKALHPGKFRCSNCKVVIELNNDGQVILC